MRTSYPLSIENVSCRYPDQQHDAIKSMSFNVKEKTITGIIGPNGAGKSTLIKTALNLIPHQGHIQFWDDTFENIRDKVAYIPQRKSIDWNFPVNVLDVCLMGMYPRIGWLKRIKKHHKEEAMNFLQQVEMQDFADKPIGALSGGQQQRVFMARALAQKADLFLLDEPMAGIDQKTEGLLFELFDTLKTQNKTIVIVHHNLQAATDHFDEVVLMNQTLIAQGNPKDVLDISTINKAYLAGHQK